MAEQASPDLGLIGKIDALESVIGPLGGVRIVDIGCGEGQVARALAERGAEVRGYDPFITGTGDWIEAGAGRYRLSKLKGEAIPEPDGSADAVIFVFSLHHVPQPRMASTLAEAGRMLKPGGKLCVAEPLAEGPGQYVMELYHDETQVRLNAQAALAAHAAPAFPSEKTLYFWEGRSFSDFESYAAQAISNMRYNGYTEADVLNPEVRRRFDEMYGAHGGKFDQKVKLSLFTG